MIDLYLKMVLAGVLTCWFIVAVLITWGLLSVWWSK